MKRISLIAAAFIGLAASATTASAFCAPQQADGNWRNVDYATNSVTRVGIAYRCGDDRWKHGPAMGAIWALRVYGACSPTDCDWGEVPARMLNNGWLVAQVDHGFARREIRARLDGGNLHVIVDTDFTDPARPDYTSDNYFVRQ